MTRTYSSILFDLDGTLIDSAPGITATLAHTFEVLGRPIPSPAKLLEFVGPPLLASFETLAHMTHIEAANALAIYRERYLETGVFHVTAYDGIPQLLSALNEHGITVGLATSKPESLARIALEHLGLLHYINVLTGASEDEVRSAKKDVVAEALIRLEAYSADLSAPVLIGDRSYDVEGAAACAVPTIFARWGYGSPAEEVGAVAVVNTPAELQALLLR